jgi:hypothetical protein
MGFATSKYAGEREVAWLGEQLAHHRLPQSSVARAIGVDPSSLSRGLRGSRSMRRDEFLAVVGVLEGLLDLADNPFARAAWDARLPASEISALSGIGVPRVIAILRGRGDPPTAEEAERLAAAFDDAGEGASFPPVLPQGNGGNPPVRGQLRDPSVLDGRIPILPAAVALGDGYLKVRRIVAEIRDVPPPLAGVPDAFGIFVGEDGLAPRWYGGEVLFLHPGKPLLEGRWAMCDIADGRSVIGMATKVDRDEVRLAPPGAADALTLPAGEVRRISVVVGAWSE